MAQAPHDKTGRKCSEPGCGVEFTKRSYVGTIMERQGAFIVQRIVCRECHNKHYSRGE